LDVAAFMFDYRNSSRSSPDGQTWFIDADSGRKIKFEEIRSRTEAFAKALKHRYAFEEDDVLLIFAPNL
jgi:4-coumarate--CoA ligase